MEDLDELDELIQGDSAEEKLKNAKEIIKGLEKEVFKLRTELKRTENVLKKFQDTATVNGQNQNNTSSAFLLPSEFKKSWEALVMENILDLFTPFLASQFDFTTLSQSLVKKMLDLVEEQINSKLIEILKSLGAESNKDKAKKILLKLFQDNYATAFPCPDISKIAARYLDSIPRPLYGKVQSLTESSDFECFVRIMHKLAVCMLLNDPVLELRFSSTFEYVRVTKPEDFYFIDGFPIGSPEAIVVIPCVTRGNFAFAGTKPAVLVLPQDFNKTPSEETEKRPLEVQKSADPYLRHVNKLPTSDEIPYPPLQRKNEDNGKKDCPLCKIKAPCAYCSKTTLLALAKRIPSCTSNQRLITRVQSNSFLESQGKSNKNLTSFLSRRLSEAAKKMDKHTYMKNRHIDKEACKVM